MNIMVIAEMFNSEIRDVTWELVASAHKMAALKRTPVKISIVIPEDDPDIYVYKIRERSGIDIIALKIPGLRSYHSESYIHCIGQLIRRRCPSHVLIAHTSQGRDFAPGLAIACEATAISGVNGFYYDEGEMLFSRPVFDGNQNQMIKSDPDRPVILTVLPGTVKAESPEGKGPGSLTDIEIPFPGRNGKKMQIRYLKTKVTSCDNVGLKEARVVISAGRGIGDRENMDLIFKFAAGIPSSAVGASRPLVDLNWIGYEHQIGMTGATVMPRLYIACGISGSSQHLAGMKDSELIVAVNTNPDAPIFRHADYCIYVDTLDFIESFLKLRGE